MKTIAAYSLKNNKTVSFFCYTLMGFNYNEKDKYIEILVQRAKNNIMMLMDYG